MAAENTDFKESKERRKYTRFPLKILLKYYLNGAKTDDLAYTRDISAKGLGLLTSQELAPDTAIDMWLQIPNDVDQIHAKGRVVWSKLCEPKYRIGIRLEDAELNPVSLVLKTIQAKIRKRNKD